MTTTKDEEKPELASEIVAIQPKGITREELQERYPGYEIPATVPTVAQQEAKAAELATEQRAREVERATRGTREEVSLAEARAMSDYQQRYALGELTPKEQFEEQVRTGVIPKGAEFVEVPAKPELAPEIVAQKQKAGRTLEQIAKEYPAYAIPGISKPEPARAGYYTAKQVAEREAYAREVKAYEEELAKYEQAIEARRKGAEAGREFKKAIIKTLGETPAQIRKQLVTMLPDRLTIPTISEVFSVETAKAFVEQLKETLKMTPEDVETARQAYLVAQQEVGLAPPSRFELSHLWRTPSVAYVMTKEEQAKIDAMDAYVEKLQGMPLKEQWIELGKYQTQVGAESIGKMAAITLPTLRSKLKAEGKDLPVPLQKLAEIVGGLSIGAFVTAPLYTAGFITRLAGTAFVPKKGEYLAEIGKGVWQYTLSLPAIIAAEPTLAVSELVGTFILGPKGMKKLLVESGARVSPAYIPKRGMGIEYSVVKVPSKLGTKASVTQAVNSAIVRALKSKKGTAVARIGDGRLRITVKSTPVSEVVGPALYHATPLIAKQLLAGKVRGILYTSPHLAIRFAESSAKGVPAARPAIVMIFTRKGKTAWQPTWTLYKGTKELEAIYSTTRLIRVKSLQSRLLGAKAGDFITVHKGKVIPIYRFAEPGAKVPPISLVNLLAIRIRSIQAGLIDLAKGKKGIVITRENLPVIKARLANAISKELKAGKSTLQVSDIVLRREVASLFRQYPHLERLYRSNPNAFEQAYVEQLNREFTRTIQPTRRLPEERIPLPERPEMARIVEKIIEPRVPVEEMPREIIVPERPPPERVPPPEEPPVAERPPVEPPTRPPVEPPTRPPVEPPTRPPVEPPTRPPVEPPTRPPIKPPPVVPPTPPTLIVPFAPRPEPVRERPIPEGSITWKMGLFWKHIAPPWTQRKPFTLPKGIAPLGAVRTHLRTPAETIQVIGSSKGVPKTISIDLGITDAYISNYGTKITFAGEGEHTDAGISLDSPTVGMSIPASIRARVRAKPKKKKKQKLSRYEYATTLKGFRP